MRGRSGRIGVDKSMHHYIYTILVQFLLLQYSSVVGTVGCAPHRFSRGWREGGGPTVHVVTRQALAGNLHRGSDGATHFLIASNRCYSSRRHFQQSENYCKKK
jgi:hypothetical protein